MQGKKEGQKKVVVVVVVAVAWEYHPPVFQIVKQWVDWQMVIVFIFILNV